MPAQKFPANKLPLLMGITTGCLAATTAGAATVQSAADIPVAGKPARPNIILILADDMGFSDLGCFGSEIDTPNLDRLAQNGLKMTQFYTTPRCCPTRASVLTGLYSHQAGIGDMMQDRGVPGYRGELARNTVTIAEQLKAAGYATTAIGKWHVAHILFDGKHQLNFQSEKPFWDHKDNWPLQRGFERYFGTIHGVNSYYDPFSLVDGNTPVEAPAVTKGRDFYYTDVLSDKAVAEIDRLAPDAAGGSKPFFMYLAYTAPHWPLQAPESVIAKYRQRYLAGWDKIRADRYQRQLQMGLIEKNWSLSPRDPRVKPWEAVSDHEWEANRMATHAAMIEIMDAGIGRVHEALKAKGIDKNTLIIFFSDNGACDESVGAGWYDVPSRLRDGTPVKVGNANRTVMAGPEATWQSYGPHWANVSSTPFLRYKHFTHEGGIATATIAHWPEGIKRPGSATNQIAHIIDIMPTFVEVAGAKHPANYAGHAVQPLEGCSLVPVFQGGALPADRPLFWEHEGNRAVRVGDWKLVSRHIKRPRTSAWELYNLAADRTEQHDLAADNTGKVASMSKLYNAWAKRCHVLPLPLPKPIRKSGGSDD